MLKWILGISIIAVFFALIFEGGSVTLGPGVKAPEVPEQTLIRERESFTHKGYELVPLADYSLRAKVLSRKDYKFGKNAKICPVDLALGWGRMSDESVLKKIKIRQSDRFYFWSTRKYPIPRKEIVSSSANVHLIPGSENVEIILREVREGEIVFLAGKLVEVKSPDGWKMVSSLSRKDSGAGSCEVLFVESAY